MNEFDGGDGRGYADIRRSVLAERVLNAPRRTSHADARRTPPRLWRLAGARESARRRRRHNAALLTVAAALGFAAGVLFRIWWIGCH